MLKNFDHGRLFVISGPSGVGKGAIVEGILARDKSIAVSISYTSRTPRANEKDKINYYFVSREKFLEMVSRNKFEEYAEVHGNYYGTAKETLENLLASGKKIVFEVDIQGGLSLKKVIPEVVTIFILPPSHDEIIRRINKRGSENAETLQKRLETMQKEMTQAHRYDHQVVNADLDQAVTEVLNIINK